MKFWKNLKTSAFGGFGTIDRTKRSESQQQQQRQQQSTPAFQRRKFSSGFNRSLQDEEPIYEDYCAAPPSPSPSSSCGSGSGGGHGTTFVELIKRPGTRLGVAVATGDCISRISELVPGSWAQRSDVLCIGDAVVSINGAPTAQMVPRDVARALELSDRVQLEVRYPLPPRVPSRARFRAKIIQVTLRKESGSFGMVVRGGGHESPRCGRPFTVVNVSPGGPAARDGTVRVNDRLRAVNGRRLHDMKLPELQSLLYQQDKDTVFTVEYDVATHDSRLDRGPVLVKIRREGSNDLLGFGLNKCGDSGHIYIESIRQASLVDRCGALHVGDILLSANGREVSQLSTEEATELIRGSSDPDVVQLEVLPGMFSRTSGLRSSMPSPCFSSLRSQRLRRPCQRYQSMTDLELRRPSSSSSSTFGNPKERRKFVTFTVELQRDGGPLGLTLATEDDADVPGPIFVSALTHDGLAERTRTVQVGDQLAEVNGLEVKDRSLNEVIPMLQECAAGSEVVKLKLARLISIPERDFSATLRRNDTFRKPPLPSPSPSCRTPVQLNRSSSRRDSSTSSNNHSPTPTNTVSLLPISAMSRTARPVPMEVHKVTLFKDRVYEDFGFSLSDGLYEKGIFLNRIRKGGPADACGLLRPLDRLLQINDTRTSDFDCCLAVPLIAAAGDKIELLVARTTGVFELRDDGDDYLADELEIVEDFEDRTLTRQQRRGRQQMTSLKRVSRTSSADGRLGGGSVTGHVVPWSPSSVRCSSQVDDCDAL